MTTVLVLVTFAAVAVLVLALAVYLVIVMLTLRRIRQTAGLILFGVQAIADRVDPVADLVGEINHDLGGAADALGSLVERVSPDVQADREAAGGSSMAMTGGWHIDHPAHGSLEETRRSQDA